MIKKILIDGKEVEMKATGLTPVIFQDFFMMDLLKNLNGKILSDDQAEQSSATTMLNQLMFVMAEQAKGSTLEDFRGMDPKKYYEWLDAFSFGGLVAAAPKAVQFFQEEAVPAAELKKTETSGESQES